MLIAHHSDLLTDNIPLLHFHRPVTERGERIPPSDLLEHRRTHVFSTPTCLCGSQLVEPKDTETAIYIARSGEFAGQYVAGCASDSCGYLGKLMLQSYRRVRY
jgi:hypothetical protein